MERRKGEPQNNFKNILVVLIKKSLRTLDFILLHGNKIQPERDVQSGIQRPNTSATNS